MWHTHGSHGARIGCQHDHPGPIHPATSVTVTCKSYRYVRVHHPSCRYTARNLVSSTSSESAGCLKGTAASMTLFADARDPSRYAPSVVEMDLVHCRIVREAWLTSVHKGHQLFFGLHAIGPHQFGKYVFLVLP